MVLLKKSALSLAGKAPIPIHISYSRPYESFFFRS